MKRTISILLSITALWLVSTAPALAQAATDVNCDGCVQSGDIATNGVRRADIQNFSINTPKLNNFAVTSEKIKTGAVTESKIADGAVTINKVSSELSADIGSSCAAGKVVVGKDSSGNFVCADSSVGCDAATEVELGGKCYYLDGSNGVCQGNDELAPQLALEFIASNFIGKTYKTTPSNNCCIEHSKTATEGQDWGMDGADCNVSGTFGTGPILGGTGCVDADQHNVNQLTFCRSR